jgi:hypothetical protein
VRNFAEITSGTDENGDPQVDDDSTPDTTPGNDVVNNDNDVSGDGNLPVKTKTTTTTQMCRWMYSTWR